MPMYPYGRSSRRVSLRRQLFFGLAIILPAAALLGVGLHTLSQERSLDAQRYLDDRERLVREVEDRLGATLTALRFEASRATQRDAAQMHAAIVWAAEMTGDRILLPWDSLAASPGALGDGLFGRQIAEGEAAEFARLDLGGALDSYRAAGRYSATSLQRSFAALAEARILRKLHRPDEALALYDLLLTTGSSERDEFGVPVCLYAAVALAESAAHHSRIGDLLDHLLHEAAPLGQMAALMVRTLVGRLEPEVTPEPPSDLTALRDAASRYVQRVEASEQLRTVIPNRMRAVPPVTGGLRDTGWFGYREDEPWLVAAWETSPGRGGALTIDVASLLASAVDVDALSWSGFSGAVLAITPQEGSRVLPTIAGLHLGFVPHADGSIAARSQAQLTWFAGMLGLLFSMTLTGGYLLWRDVQREAGLARLRSDFVSSVSHELKTPLAAIRMYAETLTIRGDDAQLRSGYLQTVLSESERLSRLLDNVLDFASMEEEARSYRLVPASLQDMLADTVRTMSYVLTQQGFELDIRIDPAVPAVNVDPDAIEQALLNLLANAVKYSGENRRIILRLEQAAGKAVISVTDFGLGIPATEHDRIFEPFIRAGAHAKHNIPGTGLGLAVVRHIVDAHGGTVAVESRHGHGSTFSIRLPIEGST